MRKPVIRLAGIGLSLVNSQLRELVYVTWRDIELKYTDSQLYQKVDSDGEVDSNRQSTLRWHLSVDRLSECGAEDWKRDGSASDLPHSCHSSQGRFLRRALHQILHLSSFSSLQSKLTKTSSSLCWILQRFQAPLGWKQEEGRA